MKDSRRWVCALALATLLVAAPAQAEPRGNAAEAVERKHDLDDE